MSAQSSRNKKRSQPGKGARRGPAASSAGAATAAGGPPAPSAGADRRPHPHDQSPLQAFRAPTVTPPVRQVAPPRQPRTTGTAPPPTTSPAAAARGPVAPPAAAAPAPARAAGPAPGTRPAGSAGTAVAGPTPGTSPEERGAAPFLAPGMPDGPVQVMSWNCSQLDGIEPHGLGMTYWFDAAPDGDPYPVSVRFTGRRVGGDPADRDQTFETVRTVDQVLPGSGRVSLTARVPGVAEGTWEVTATPVVLRGADGSASPAPRGRLPQGTATGTTAYFPVVNVRAPGMRIGAWPTLVGAGFVGALVVQWLLAAQRGLPTGQLLLLSVLASLIGLAGAKAYYLFTHRTEKVSALRAGMSVQGFVLAAMTTLLLGVWWVDIPVGPALDVSAPGLLLGMTIGRLGCFFGGCCVGRPTASRWGIWSSDRRVGVRRIPVQLIESTMAGTVATAILLAVALLEPAVDGLLFVIGLSAYTFGRQVLFPLRGIPRTTAYGRVAMMVLTGIVVIGCILWLVAA